MKLLSVDPDNYQDAPTEGIRRILEDELSTPFPREDPIATSHIKSIRMGTTVRTAAPLVPCCVPAELRVLLPPRWGGASASGSSLAGETLAGKRLPGKRLPVLLLLRALAVIPGGVL